MKINPADYPVMKACCKTCPFKLDANNKMQDLGLANRVVERTLFKAHQLCHGTKDTTRCKGSFDYNFAIYDRMGFGDLVAQ